MIHRIERLKRNIGLKEEEALLITSPVNRRYYAGFTGTAGAVFCSRGRNLFLTDFRYAEQAQAQCPGFEIIEMPAGTSLFDFLSGQALSVLYVEENHLTMASAGQVSQKAPKAVLKPLDEQVAEQRVRKEASEIEKISEAARIADAAFLHILDFLKPGRQEKEIALELEFFMRRQGAEGLSFETIVASGNRSAMPHGVASGKRIQNGEFVTMDFGCRFEGYCSDMTRTIHMGPASEEERRVYALVLRAQQKALACIRAGVRAAAVDKCARDIIMEGGYGERFGHGLGHGVGLEVHEAPRLSPKGDTVLAADMVVTDEPGIYLPGRFGIRIEDLVVVGACGCRVLSSSPKDLIEIGNG